MKDMQITVDYILERYKHRTFYLYHILGKKWGCTLDIERRLRRQGFNKNDCVEIKEVIGVRVADRLEKYLNEREGYPYNHTQSYIRALLNQVKRSNKQGKSTHTNRKSYKRKPNSNRWNRHIGIGLKKAYAEGRRTEPDRSYLNTQEYKEKISKNSLKMWKNPKRKEMMPKGPDVGNAVFTAEDVRYIRKNYPLISGIKLASKFNCSKSAIYNILKGKTYSSVK